MNTAAVVVFLLVYLHILVRCRSCSSIARVSLCWAQSPSSVSARCVPSKRRLDPSPTIVLLFASWSFRRNALAGLYLDRAVTDLPWNVFSNDIVCLAAAPVLAGLFAP
jgi:hypothetical protein